MNKTQQITSHIHNAGKIRLLLLLFAMPISLFGQKIEYEKNDSIHIDSSTFTTYILKINNFSATDPAKIFIIPGKSIDSLKKQIPKLYFSKKQEYNEYYVLGVADMSQTEKITRALTEFIIQIDSSRAARNRSTFLRFYGRDQVNNKITPQPTDKDLSQVANLHYLNSTRDLCKYMICPH